MSDAEEYTPCYCVHCTPGGELCPRCHPESRDATVCVRLDGLADKIAEALAENDYNWAGGYKQNAVAVVALLQSLAVQ